MRKHLDPCIHPRVKILGSYTGPDIPVFDVRGGPGVRGQPLTAENINAYFASRETIVIMRSLKATHPREEAVNLKPDL